MTEDTNQSESSGLPPEQSPIRPKHPEKHVPGRPRLIPAKPPTGPLPPEEPTAAPQPAPPEADPAQTLDRLRERMSKVAEEFATGKINRAQFHAIYNRYNDQRTIIEKLMARDPASAAWRQVAQPGHTSFLRQHFTSRVLFFAIFPLGKGLPIVRHGDTLPRPGDLLPILKALPGFLKQRGALGPAHKRVNEGHWLVVVPGQQTVSIALYSLEPAAQQIQKIADLHNDFERANARALTQGDYDREHLVFPQRALFEARDGTGPF